MAVRSDVQIFYNLSPRLVKIDAPSTEITIQDLHDTLRDIEDEPANLVYPDIISTAGKESLGGGVLVGLTATLLNAQVMFERRTNVVSTGTITTASTPSERAMLLIDAGATFITDGVKRSDIVINEDDGNSFSEVLSVDSENQLTVLAPTGGSENDFDIGEAYTIYEMVQCNVTGGNLVALDDVDAELDPVFPTFGTQVVRTSASSATLQELLDIQHSSFNGGVTVDVTSIYSGTAFPNGTPRQPVNNMADALTIATSRGFSIFYIIGNVTLDSGPNLVNKIFIGESRDKTTITIQAAATVSGTEFRDATITGTLDGANSIEQCLINDLVDIDGTVANCLLTGTITLAGTGTANLINCWSGDPTTSPEINMGGSGSALGLQNYNGSITLSNKTGSEEVDVELNSGSVTIEDTVTTGTITLRGIGKWANKATYTGGATVVDELLSVTEIIAGLDANTYDGKTFSAIIQDLLAMANGRIVESPSGTFSFYEQDNTTIRFTLIKSGNQRTRV